MSTMNQPLWGRLIQSTVQTVLTLCLVGIYFQWVIPVNAFVVPAWSIWIINVPAWQIWSSFNLSFVTTCSTPEMYPGLNVLSNDDTVSVCSVPWSYQGMIIGTFLASYGHLINDLVYQGLKGESGVAGGIASGAINDAAESWHNNAAATLETMSLGSSTGLIAALSDPDWGVYDQIYINEMAHLQPLIL